MVGGGGVRVSCVETMLGDGPLRGKFARARAAGFDGVDLRGDTLRSVIDEACRLIDDTGVDVPTIYGRLPTSLLAGTAAQRAETVSTIRDRLECAAAVGARWLVVVPIFGEVAIHVGWPGGVEEAERALLLIQLGELAAAAEEHQVQILLEPLNRSETHLLRSPADTADLTRLVASPWVATMADTYHMDLERQDMVAEVTAAGDQLRLVHVSDSDRALPGDGGIDFGPLVGALAVSRYDGYLGFECRGPCGADDLKRSVEFIRSLS